MLRRRPRRPRADAVRLRLAARHDRLPRDDRRAGHHRRNPRCQHPGRGVPGPGRPGGRATLGRHRRGNDTVTVEPDGRWTAVDRAGTRRTGRLTAADLDRLRLLAAEPRLTEGGTADAVGRCSDAYEYRLTVGTATVDWTDCPVAGTPPQAASALVALVLTAAG